MALTPEQQATLQLLLERGQSYADLAKLLGQDESDVRARARAALTELGGTDPDRNVGLTDYLLGQADPIGRADASRHLREDPEDHKLASDLCETLRAMYPAAELPRLPGEPRTVRRRPRKAERAAGADAADAGSARASLSASQTRTIVIAASAGVLLLVIVLAIAGVFSGSGDDSTAQTDAASTSTTAEADQPIQRVALNAVDGGDAKGDATFGLATGDQPFVDVSIDGLDPAPNDQTYVVWLMIDDEQGYPLSPITVSGDGSFQNRFSIPSAVLPLVARVQFVDVSIAPVQTVRKLVRDAIKNTQLVIEEPGELILRGRIPKAASGAGDSGGSGGG